MAKNRIRFRTWTAIVYPESAPADWMTKLEELCVPSFVSPLHDKDIDGDGNPKTPHWHIMLMFSGMQSQDAVKRALEPLNCALPQGVKDPRGMARYLCHLDSPSKYQYDPSDVVSLNGADYLAMISTPADRYQAIREMMAWCQEQNCLSFSGLLEYAAINKASWFRALCDNSALIMTEYLKSRKWSIDNGVCVHGDGGGENVAADQHDHAGM